MAEALRRRSFVVVVVVAVLVITVGLLTTRPWQDDGPTLVTRGGPDAADMADNNPEKEEQSEKAEEKREAFEHAVEAGKAGKPFAVTVAAAAGWAGESLMDSFADDWEPAIAADPSAPWVYMLSTRYGTTKPCPGNCPDPCIALEISSDGGATWTEGVPLCACKGAGQFDPIIEVVPNTGHVYAVYMNGFNIMFTKSTNHGATWSAPVKVYGNVSWNDKPVLAVSNDGQHVYVPFNGPTGGDPWLAQSHNGGTSWTQLKLVDSNRYYFAFDADVAPNGTVYLGQSAILYGGGGNKGTVPSGAIDEHVFVSTNNGHHLDRPPRRLGPAGPRLHVGGLPARLLPRPPRPLGRWLQQRRLPVRRGDHDRRAPDGHRADIDRIRARPGAPPSRSRRRAPRPSTRPSSPPATATSAPGTCRRPANNVDQWNVYYRRSTDGGVTWSPAVDISDASSGAAYKSAAGFLEPYGDYGEIAITSAGKTIAVWAEGTSYNGPGGVWFNREP